MNIFQMAYDYRNFFLSGLQYTLLLAVLGVFFGFIFRDYSLSAPHVQMGRAEVLGDSLGRISSGYANACTAVSYSLRPRDVWH